MKILRNVNYLHIYFVHVQGSPTFAARFTNKEEK